MRPADASPPSEHYTTLEAAKLLGMAVRSVQLMVDRNELDAWKTPGGHRRISRASVERWLKEQQLEAPTGTADKGQPAAAAHGGCDILLIEDSVHFQNLVGLVVKRHFPDATLEVASDGIAGLALCGRLQPRVLVVDILLPGVDGATLVTTLRSHPQFAHIQLIVITSLDKAQRAPYEFALEGVDVIHKPDLVAALPRLLAAKLAAESMA